MSGKAPSVNHITIAGNLVKEPELINVGERKIPKISITLAHNRSYKDKEGNWKEDTSYIDVEAWSKLAERVNKSASKGNPVLVEGTLKQDRWKGKDDKTKSRMFIRAEKIHILDI